MEQLAQLLQNLRSAGGEAEMRGLSESVMHFLRRRGGGGGEQIWKISQVTLSLAARTNFGGPLGILGPERRHEGLVGYLHCASKCRWGEGGRFRAAVNSAIATINGRAA